MNIHDYGHYYKIEMKSYHYDSRDWTDLLDVWVKAPLPTSSIETEEKLAEQMVAKVALLYGITGPADIHVWRYKNGRYQTDIYHKYS